MQHCVWKQQEELESIAYLHENCESNEKVPKLKLWRVFYNVTVVNHLPIMHDVSVNTNARLVDVVNLLCTAKNLEVKIKVKDVEVEDHFDDDIDNFILMQVD